MLIGNQNVGQGHPPFIVAEMSGNHNQSLDRALAIVDAAAQAGAHAIKLQTYTADTITLDVQDKEFYISAPKSLWKGQSLHELYQKAYTPWEWHRPIIKRAQEKGLLCFSSPFDHSAVDFLEALGVPAYKIASFENTDLPLIRKVASTGKPIIISTGMASIAELGETVACVRNAGCEDLILLKCTSTYPASPENTNISTIPHMRDLFQCEVGLSDHTMGVGVSVASVALGATVIEKHFTLSREDGGVDSTFSLEPHELQSLVIESKRAWQALGTITYGATQAEQSSHKNRRSLYIAKDMQPGDILTPENLRCVRPGLGLPPKYYDICLGRKVKQAAPKGTAMTWELIA
ncbi:MAG: pseudaminic acid synthase [Myxococcota bacterium]|nr:pseudaminic acid synthase [Myxococcota bacterium]